MDIDTVMRSLSISPRSAPVSVDLKMAPLSPPPFVPALRFQLSPQKVSLPPLAVAIRAASVTPRFALDKSYKDSTTTSRVARRILQDERNAKSRLVFDFSVEEMAQFYHLPQRVAAKCLGVAVITVKRNCKRRGIKWPYRAEKLKYIQRTKALKLSRYCRNARTSAGSGPGSSGAKMTPMLLLSEAARAFSRLPTSPPSSPQLSPAVNAPKSASPKKAKIARRPKRSAGVTRVILRGSAKRTRKCRVVFNFVVEDLAPFFHMPQRQAAKLLGVAPITIKRACKRCGIRWPYRDAKLKVIQDVRMRERAAIHCDNASSASEETMPSTSSAALAFARLPYLCMEENVARAGCRV
ncbi:hypothetical protein PybrP1_003955 [[Pythium] brassicae (nom. inval.)]|nr:hypothetical protein PybrP1_003955 [[Pythium] brassicae (nom. inval.)]